MAESELSEAAKALWGKYGDGSLGWLPLWRHLADSADVATRLWDAWLSTAVRRRIGRDLPDGEEDGRRLVTWLAGVHDIGKATPAFATKVQSLAKRMRECGFAFDKRVETPDVRRAPHSTIGHIVLSDWLERCRGWSRWEAEPFAVVVGGHHGLPPTDVDIDFVSSRPELIGIEGLWRSARDELLDWMARRADVENRLAAWRGVELSQPTQALLTAIVIVADWIASNEELFPYGPDLRTQTDRVKHAWELLDLPTPWRAAGAAIDNKTLYSSRFALPAGASPYPLQEAVADVARTMPVPGLLIVEAPMGEGKTEAALAAVEILGARTGAGGCYVALPTRATSDAMFHRVLGWLTRLTDADVGRGAHDVALVHAKALLNSEFEKLYREVLPSAIGIDEGGADVAVHRWLAGRKRKLLSSFGIGTIDQLLFAALKSRHVVLRHLGLAGKVVVIDEAHAYDVYMNQFLDRALTWLGAHGVPVIVLSATLPANRRAEMLAAYDDGRLGPRTRMPRQSRGHGEEDPYQAIRDDRRYPLLSYTGERRVPAAVACAAAKRGISVRLEEHADDPLVLAGTLQTALENGGCALIVCNTVTRVQHIATILRHEFGSSIPVSVAHSRFMGPDRAEKDQWLRDTFGPPDRLAELGFKRPDKHVVVASQVAEQSLDIDFDLLVTDLAPVDLMLQRLGRLHRHARATRPHGLTQPRCLVIGADWSTQPPTPVSGSLRVYERSALLRAAAVLWPYLEQDEMLKLPEDITLLVQEAYGVGKVGPASWQPVLEEAAQQAARREHERRQRAQPYRLAQVQPGVSLVGWLAAHAGETESSSDDDSRGRAHVRDGSESLEVLVLVRRSGRLVTPPWLGQDGG